MRRLKFGRLGMRLGQDLLQLVPGPQRPIRQEMAHVGRALERIFGERETIGCHLSEFAHAA